MKRAIRSGIIWTTSLTTVYALSGDGMPWWMWIIVLVAAGIFGYYFQDFTDAVKTIVKERRESREPGREDHGSAGQGADDH